MTFSIFGYQWDNLRPTFTLIQLIHHGNIVKGNCRGAHCILIDRNLKTLFLGSRRGSPSPWRSLWVVHSAKSQYPHTASRFRSHMASRSCSFYLGFPNNQYMEISGRVCYLDTFLKFRSWSELTLASLMVMAVSLSVRDCSWKKPRACPISWAVTENWKLNQWLSSRKQ